MNGKNISWGGVVTRLLFGVGVVLATFNPSGHSFYHWLLASDSTLPVKAFVGVLLVIAWVVCLRTAKVSLGNLGMVLGAALLATVVWMLVASGALQLHGTSALTWVVLLVLGLLLGLGLSWSLLRARLTGQVEVQ